MIIIFPRFARRFAAPVLAALFTCMVPLAQAADVREIRIAVPDLSAGTQHSGTGTVDVLRNQQLLEKAFAEDGIKVQWNFFKGAGPAINEALANGQVDFAYLGDLAAIIGKANGLDTRVLSANGRGIKQYLAVNPEAGIKTLQDLKGKHVAIFRGTAYQLSFAAALASQGLKEKDLKVINLDINAAVAALGAKQIDATWGSASLTALRDRGLAEIPLTTLDLRGAGSIQSVLVGYGPFIDAHPEVVDTLLKANAQALHWLQQESNRQAYIELVSGLANYPQATLQDDLQGLDLSVRFDPRLDPAFLAQLQASVDLAAEHRLIRKPFKVSEWLWDKAL
ncbi:ABC transporter substrate-binding protein [Pseudomonas syringae]|nr:ABC transporter substrate-binding protein [Pseudomonas syringae]MBD8789793.1 ABC transporter substrate-binding protein [Pseudomonas syringae]MBD8800982.1 ABC transporter substrate-binding protein [Pseudomonas syringae]MBD8812363.1 ABC transporter substrate-binding protein [Pseudomonas syringae]